MTDHHENCLICGAPLVYFPQAREMECARCHRTFLSNACCREGHYICDECHEQEALDRICALALEDRTCTDPVALADRMMADPFVHMHGPEHHVLFAAALVTAYANAGGRVNDRAAALQEVRTRGSQVPGGACGFWGACGAGIAAGIFVSVVTKSTPLAGRAWGLSNRMTARALAAIGKIDGPRCCKRDGYLAMEEAVDFVRQELGVEMTVTQPIQCGFLAANSECLGRACPFSPAAVRQAGAHKKSAPQGDAKDQ